MQCIGGRLGWEVEVESHFAVGSGGIVGELEELAPEGLDRRFRCHRHGRNLFAIRMLKSAFSRIRISCSVVLV